MVGIQQSSNVPAVALWDMEPVADVGYRKMENVRTNQNALWGKALRLFLGNSYAEFYTAGQYSTLSMTIAPADDFFDSSEMVLEIYGDDDALLDSYDVDYKTTPTDISVDVSGQEYVKLVWTRIGGGSNVGLLMKNAQFQ